MITLDKHIQEWNLSVIVVVVVVVVVVVLLLLLLLLLPIVAYASVQYLLFAVDST